MIDPRRQNAEAIARRYIGTPELMKPLGSGAEGFVFPTPSATAVKVLTYPEKFTQELAAYRRLRACHVTEICGIAIPRLVNFNRDMLIIEMTLVQPPYLLDFAQSRLDTPLDFPEGLDEWWDRLSEVFEDRLPLVQTIFYELIECCGIYYYDLAPRNLNFGEDPKSPDLGFS